jgi:excisionase family DNA binding protein
VSVVGIDVIDDAGPVAREIVGVINNSDQPAVRALASAMAFCAMLKIAVRTVRELIYTGILPAKKFGRRVRMPRAWLDQWIAEQPSLGRSV